MTLTIQISLIKVITKLKVSINFFVSKKYDLIDKSNYGAKLC